MKNQTRSNYGCFCDKNAESHAINLKNLVYGEVHITDIKEHQILYVTNGFVQMSTHGYREIRHILLKEGDFIFAPIGYRLSCFAHQESSLLSISLIGSIPSSILFNVNKSLCQQLKVFPEIHVLSANNFVKHFAEGLIMAIDGDIHCMYYAETKAAEIVQLLHVCYQKEEFVKFFSLLITPDAKFSEFVKLNYLKYSRVSELADALSMTSRQFANRFKNVFGMPPLEWIQKDMAGKIYVDICHAHKPLKNIAYKYGFSAPSSFSRYCRKTYGTSAVSIRKGVNS